MKIVSEKIDPILLKDVIPGEVVRVNKNKGDVFILKTWNQHSGSSHINAVDIKTGEYTQYAENTVVEPLPDAVFYPYGVYCQKNVNDNVAD